MESAIGIIGGSGLYEIDGLEEVGERVVVTPFGKPSDALIGGRYRGRQVWFLPRHGRGHRILPHEINHRANIWALRSLGVRWIICVTAVGSLREQLHPRDVVVIDQYFDRMSGRAAHTFFGEGIAGHVGFGLPLSEGMRGLLIEAARAEGLQVHDRGTYVNMDGPAFSTKAESEVHRKLGFDVVGMTNLAEAKLAREAEIALASLAMVTDYDCWHEEEEHVNVETVVGHMKANSVAAKRVLQRVIPMIPEQADWPEHRALDGAIMTPREQWPEDRVRALAPILEGLESAR
jgi:5'-methylthioadenosine phosphorylase